MNTKTDGFDQYVVDLRPKRTLTFDAISARIEAAINVWRVLSHEAFQRRDETAAWEAGQQILELQKWRDSLKGPNS